MGSHSVTLPPLPWMRRAGSRAGSGCCALLGLGLGLAPWHLPRPQLAVPRAAPRWGHSPASHSATQLKPDVGTPELPAGRVRVRRDDDGTVTEVDEDSVQRVSAGPWDIFFPYIYISMYGLLEQLS